MKTAILTSILFVTAVGAQALACKVTPMTASVLQTQTVVKHLAQFSDQGAIGIRQIAQVSDGYRAEILFQRANGKNYCRAYDFKVQIAPDCSARVTTQRGAYRCER